jgi:hypothetical protein
MWWVTLGEQTRVICRECRRTSSSTAEEYRTYLNGNRIDPGGLNQGYSVTSGFALECLHFLPINQPYSTFRYLGDEAMGARDAYVVALARGCS